MSNTWLGKALKKHRNKMSFGPNYRNYLQGSPIPQPMTATEVMQRQLEAQMNMARSLAAQSLVNAQQTQAITRQAFVPSIMAGIITASITTNAGSGYASQCNIEQSKPAYETPDWLTAMHTTIDELHANGI